MSGGADDDTLNGGAGDDELHGGTGDDILEGDGDDDTFFIQPGNGYDYIVDFEDTNNDEKIDLADFESIETYEQLSMLMRQQGTSVVIDLSGHGGGNVTLQDVTMTDLDALDFILVA